jgi:hypothetical protein
MADAAGHTPAVRLSDAERRQVIDLLASHAAAGRLTLYEMEERMAAAARATTHAEIAPLFADLPAVAPPRLDRQGTPRPPGHSAWLAVRIHATVYAAIIAFLVVIWLLTGHGYFWPIWPALGWGVALATHAGVTRAAVD